MRIAPPLAVRGAGGRIRGQVGRRAQRPNLQQGKAWMAGPSPAMTVGRYRCAG
jgi:hypothetical protein